jgi:hypothetical protein
MRLEGEIDPAMRAESKRTINDKSSQKTSLYNFFNLKKQKS